MPRETATYRLADYLLRRKGGLAQFVTERRASGRSWRLITRELYEVTHGRVDVTYETLRGWFLDDDKDGEAA